MFTFDIVRQERNNMADDICVAVDSVCPTKRKRQTNPDNTCTLGWNKNNICEIRKWHVMKLN